MRFPKLWCATLAILVLCLPSNEAAGMDTAFSYQAVLSDAGAPADGTYDLRFILYDSEVGGSQVGTTLYGDDVVVEKGLFTVYLDFGAGAFNGGDLWLEVAVRPGDSTGVYTPLAPRQAVLPTPYALHAATIDHNAVGSSELAPDTVDSGHVIDNSIDVSDIDTTAVQARVAGGCGQGSAIRTIHSDGTVECQQDFFLSPVRVGPFHAESYNGVDAIFNWNKPPQQSGFVSFCFLTRVQLRDVDNDDEDAFCQVIEQSFRWQLLASTEDGRDNDAMCSMMCLYWYGGAN